MTSPSKNQHAKHIFPTVEDCSEPVLVAAVIAKLTAQKGEQFIRIDALLYFSGNPGKLAPMVMKACERVNNADFEKKLKGLVGEIKVAQLPPGKAVKLSVKENVINLG